MTKCHIDKCQRDAVAWFQASINADGEILDDEFRLPFCEPCKNAADWAEAWPQSEYSWVAIRE